MTSQGLYPTKQKNTRARGTHDIQTMYEYNATHKVENPILNFHYSKKHSQTIKIH